MGDSSSLQGGLLLMTSLRGIDGKVYSIAQGPLVIGGYVAGGAGNTQVVNHPTMGRVPGGAIVERPSPAIEPTKQVRLQLHEADFTTAARIADAVNHHFNADTPAIAHADNSGLVSVAIPKEFSTRTTEFIAEIEGLTVQTDRPSKVVINERTGTIVMGKEVRVSPVAIMHGDLTVEIQTTYDVSQPGPLSNGSTQVTPQVSVGVKEEKARNVVLKEGATVEELVRALSSIGVYAPRHYRYSAKPARGRRVGIGNRSYLAAILMDIGIASGADLAGSSWALPKQRDVVIPENATFHQALHSASSDMPQTDMPQKDMPQKVDTPEKISGAAKQFEALMIEQMLKSARDTSGGGWLGGEDDPDDQTGSLVMELGEQGLAQAMAVNGGLGIAKMVTANLERGQLKTASSDSEAPPSSFAEYGFEAPLSGASAGSAGPMAAPLAPAASSAFRFSMAPIQPSSSVWINCTTSCSMLSDFSACA